MQDLKQSLAREQYLNIPAFDKKNIYCIVNYAGDTPSDKAVVLAHGLTGNPNEFIHMAARDYFNALGYDVYRIAFYASEPNCRMLHETTLAIHALDMNSLITHAKPNHKKLFVCGHSYGGLTMVFANPQVDAIAFWDPSFYPWDEFMEEDAAHIAEMSLYSIGGSTMKLMGKAMVEEARSLVPEKIDPMAAKITAPSLVVDAENGGLGNSPKLFETLTCEKSYEMIKDADHCFVKGHIIQPLLEATQSWFEKFN